MEKSHSTSTPAHPSQNFVSSETDVDVKRRERNDMDRPTRHVPQILFIYLFIFFEAITK